MEYGIKVSRGGKDVLTCPDKHLSLCDKYETLKIALEGETELVAGSNEIHITHNLGYKPFCIVMATTNEKKKSTQLPSGYPNYTTYGLFGGYNVTTTELIINVSLLDQYLNPYGSGVAKYYLLQREL